MHLSKEGLNFSYFLIASFYKYELVGIKVIKNPNQLLYSYSYSLDSVYREYKHLENSVNMIPYP